MQPAALRCNTWCAQSSSHDHDQPPHSVRVQRRVLGSRWKLGSQNLASSMLLLDAASGVSFQISIIVVAAVMDTASLFLDLLGKRILSFDSQA